MNIKQIATETATMLLDNGYDETSVNTLRDIVYNIIIDVIDYEQSLKWWE